MNGPEILSKFVGESEKNIRELFAEAEKEYRRRTGLHVYEHGDKVYAVAVALGGRVILVLGGPGSGVAEQCDRLADKYGCLHLGIESLMRTAVANESDAGKKISEPIKGGMRAIDTLTSSRLGSHRFMRVRTGKIIPAGRIAVRIIRVEQAPPAL